MTTTQQQPAQNYYNAVLTGYCTAKEEFLNAYEALQNQSPDQIKQRQDALVGLSNPDHAIRRISSRILLKHAVNLGAHVGLLVGRLKDYDCEVVLNLCSILTALGGQALQAIDALNWHIAGKNPALRNAAQKAVIAIIDDFGRDLCAGMGRRGK